MTNGRMCQVTAAVMNHQVVPSCLGYWKCKGLEGFAVEVDYCNKIEVDATASVVIVNVDRAWLWAGLAAEKKVEDSFLDNYMVQGKQAASDIRLKVAYLEMVE